MKLYKVYFTGYHVVAADDGEEAISKCIDGDWIEELIDHSEGIEEMEDLDE